MKENSNNIPLKDTIYYATDDYIRFDDHISGLSSDDAETNFDDAGFIYGFEQNEADIAIPINGKENS